MDSYRAHANLNLLFAEQQCRLLTTDMAAGQSLNAEGICRAVVLHLQTAYCYHLNDLLDVYQCPAGGVESAAEVQRRLQQRGITSSEVEELVEVEAGQSQFWLHQLLGYRFVRALNEGVLASSSANSDDIELSAEFVELCYSELAALIERQRNMSLEY